MMYRVTLAICRGLMEAEELVAPMAQASVSHLATLDGATLAPLDGASLAHLDGASVSHLDGASSLAGQEQDTQYSTRSGSLT